MKTNIFRGVLFDLDGVLIDSYESWFHLFNETLEYFGFKKITEQTFRQHWGQSTEEDVRIFMPGKTVAEVRDYFHDNFGHYLPYIKINPDVFPVLENIRALPMKMGCVTNSHHAIVQEIFKDHGLEEYFHVVITADDIARPKPAPDMLLEACAQLRMAPGETMFIGDTFTDQEASEKAGCMFIGYRLDVSVAVSDLPAFWELLKKKIS